MSLSNVMDTAAARAAVRRCQQAVTAASGDPTHWDRMAAGLLGTAGVIQTAPDGGVWIASRGGNGRWLTDDELVELVDRAEQELQPPIVTVDVVEEDAGGIAVLVAVETRQPTGPGAWKAVSQQALIKAPSRAVLGEIAAELLAIERQQPDVPATLEYIAGVAQGQHADPHAALKDIEAHARAAIAPAGYDPFGTVEDARQRAQRRNRGLKASREGFAAAGDASGLQAIIGDAVREGASFDRGDFVSRNGDFVYVPLQCRPSGDRSAATNSVEHVVYARINASKAKGT